MLHAVAACDGQLSYVLKQPLLFIAAGFAERLGQGEAMAQIENPIMNMATVERVMESHPVNIEIAKEYMRDVYAAMEQYLDGATGETLDSTIQGRRGNTVTIFDFLYNNLVRHPAEHVGEISCIKGMRGLKGY